MRKPKYLNGRKKLINFTEKMAADMRSFCGDRNIKSESELVRKAVAKYIYTDCKDKTPDSRILKQIQEMLARCRLSVSFK